MKQNDKEKVLDDAFNDCLEMVKEKGASASECMAKYPKFREELEPALTAALSMRAGSITGPDNAYKARVKDALIGGSNKSGRRPFVPNRLVRRVTAATLAFALLLSGVGYASTDAMPDEPLYPLKQLIEKVRLAVAADKAAEVEARLAIAEERLREADAMCEAGNTEEARQALNRYTWEMREAYRLAGLVPGKDKDILLAKFAVLSQRHLFVLQGVYDRAPDAAKPAITRAMTFSAQGLEKAEDAILTRERLQDKDQLRDGTEDGVPTQQMEQDRDRLQNQTGSLTETPGNGSGTGQVQTETQQQTETSTQQQTGVNSGQGQGNGSGQGNQP